MKHKRNWAIGIILSAAAAFAALQNVAAPTHEVITTEVVATISATAEPSPTASSNSYGGCGYQWAYQDDPELTAKVDEAIRQLDPAATARAQQFGENCVYEDGHATFSALETDFYVHRPIEDLTDNESFGNWMAQVMPLITQIPREELKGNNDGFVEFWFNKSETEHLVVRVPIQKYLNDAQGKTGNEFLQLFLETP